MSTLSYTLLDDRGVLSVAGEDARAFLQGLVSNDMDRIGPDRAAWAALLTAQGKYLHDFFVFQGPAPGEGAEAFLIDCEGARRDDLLRRLRPYRLRSKVDLADRTGDMCVAVVCGDSAAAAEAFGLPLEEGAARAVSGGVAGIDPRFTGAGVRVVIARDGAEAFLKSRGAAPAEASDYDRLRMDLGLPDGSRDMVVDKSVLLEGAFDELNGVAFDKGCYLGQELTARTKYRGLVKRRLLPVVFDGPAPEPGTAILMEGREVGEMRSARDGRGLAMLRIDALERGGGKQVRLAAGETTIVPRRPAWAGRSNGNENDRQEPAAP